MAIRRIPRENIRLCHLFFTRGAASTCYYITNLSRGVLGLPSWHGCISCVWYQPRLVVLLEREDAGGGWDDCQRGNAEGSWEDLAAQYSVCAHLNRQILPKGTLLVQSLPFRPSLGYPRNKGRWGKAGCFLERLLCLSGRQSALRQRQIPPGYQSSLRT